MFLLLVLLGLIRTSSSCPLTDEYLNRCHCGILTNGESYIQCDEYSLYDMPIFKRSFPYDELRLSKNFIRVLTSSSLENIRTIKRIHLEENPLEFIDPDLFRLLGNYLEELTLTGDGHIQSLEFLTRYPLKKLRVLRLDRFDLSQSDLKRIFQNMTKLQNLSLRSCQLKEIPQLDRISILDLEKNNFTRTIFLSTNYSEVNLASNRISSIVLQQNPNLIKMNLSMNDLREFYSIVNYNPKLKVLDLSDNRLSAIDWSMLGENLTHLNLSSNNVSKVHFPSLPGNLLDLSLAKNSLEDIHLVKMPKSLKSLNLSSNSIRTLDRAAFLHQLIEFDLSKNPLDCNCRLQWLKEFPFNTSSWTCSTPSSSSFLFADFKCQSMSMPRLISWNITFVQLTANIPALFLQWKITDPYQTIRYLQISLESPYRLSTKFTSNQTYLLLKQDIQFNQRYHLCLILVHQYARDRYCREVFTQQPSPFPFESNSFDDHLLTFVNHEENDELMTTTMNLSSWIDLSENHFRLMLIGSCLGGLITMILLFTCCYLCYQLHRYRRIRMAPPPPARSSLTYPKTYFNQPYHLCPHRIYHSENLSSNSTDSTQMDSSLSTTCSAHPNKHIYQTIDSQDYCSLTRADKHLFDLWNESIRERC